MNSGIRAGPRGPVGLRCRLFHYGSRGDDVGIHFEKGQKKCKKVDLGGCTPSWMLVEAAWNDRFPARKTRHLEAKANTAPERVQTLAWQAQKRLCGRYRSLSHARKVDKRSVSDIRLARAEYDPMFVPCNASPTLENRSQTPGQRRSLRPPIGSDSVANHRASRTVSPVPTPGSPDSDNSSVGSQND